MRPAAFFDRILIDEYSTIPKYLQLVNSIVKVVESGNIVEHFPLPSINELSFRLEISRDTIEKRYRHLKKIGVINSVHGKGYYVSNINFKQKLKIFLLFNKISAFKKNSIRFICINAW
jgi:DNA-binding transcriptional regulator YhcF (GntR family)